MDQAAEMASLANTKVFALPFGQEDEPFDLRIANLRLPTNTFSRDPVLGPHSRRRHGDHPGHAGSHQHLPRKPDGTVDTKCPAGDARSDARQGQEGARHGCRDPPQ